MEIFGSQYLTSDSTEAICWSETFAATTLGRIQDEVVYFKK